MEMEENHFCLSLQAGILEAFARHVFQSSNYILNPSGAPYKCSLTLFVSIFFSDAAHVYFWLRNIVLYKCGVLDDNDIYRQN